MAHLLKRDSIDFAAYLDATENCQNVRKASEFFDEVRATFDRKDSGTRYPSMTSTKAGHLLQFAPGNITTWAGFNGHKKSMLTSQVALDLCAQGHRVLIASLEMTPAETLARMSQQAAARPRPSDEFLGEFQDWTDGKLWIFDKMGRVTPDQVLGLCRYFANELNGAHIFLDSMMMIVGSEESMDEQKNFVSDLLRAAQETGLHVHLVAHCRKPPSTGEGMPPTRYDIKGTSAISDQSSNVVMVWFNKAKQQALEKNPNDEEQLRNPDALMIIDKQRHGTYEGKLKLWFDGASLRFCDDRISAVQPYDLQRQGGLA